MNPEWTNVIIGLVSLIFGGLGGLIGGVWRVAKIEGHLKLYFKKNLDQFETKSDETDRKLEDKMDRTINAFGETVRALREKINLVEKDMIQNYVAKEDFNDFRIEYREDMRDLKKKIEQIPNKENSYYYNHPTDKPR